MRSRHFTSPALFALLASFAAGTLCVDADAQRRRRSSWRDRVGLKNFVFKSDQEFDTKAVRDGVYSVFLPKDYDDAKNKEKRYPVIYFLHGLNEDHNRFNSRGGARVLDKIVGENGCPQMIFVCAYDGSRRSFWIDRGSRKIEAMIVKDLVTHVDKKYRTIANRDNRAIMGVSMGGYGAMKIAFKYPETFGAVATHSAAILPAKYDDLGKMFPWATQRGFAASIFGDPVDEKIWTANNPLALATKTDVAKLRSLKIYFDCGDRDRYGLEATNLQMHELLKKRKVEHTWRLVKDGGHGWNTRSSEVGYNVANLPNSLRFIGAAWTQKRAMTGLKGLMGGKDAKNGNAKSGRAKK